MTKSWINNTLFGPALISQGYNIMELCGVLDMPYGKLVKKLRNPKLCTVVEMEKIAKTTGMDFYDVTMSED